jgi:hypothetical protein
MEKSQKRPEATENATESQAITKKGLPTSPSVWKLALAALRIAMVPPMRPVAKPAAPTVRRVLMVLMINAQQLPMREQSANMPMNSSKTVAPIAIMKAIWVQRTNVLKINVVSERYFGIVIGLPFCVAAFWSCVVSVAVCAQLKAGLEQFVFPPLVEQ